MKPKATFKNWTLHIGPSGRANKFEAILMEKSEEENPRNNVGDSPLHCAAIYGRFDVCKYIMETIEEKVQEMTMVTHRFMWLLDVVI